MDKKTVLAIVLSVIVISVSMTIQSTFFTPVETYDSTTTSQEYGTEQEQVSAVELIKSATDNSKLSTEKFEYETNLYTITFDPVGASIESLVMKEHANADGEHVNLIFKGEEDDNAFLLYWGDDIKNPILDTFAYKVDGKKVIFSNSYTDANGQKFTLVKTYEFKDGEYLFAVTIDIVGEGSFNGLNNDSYAYSIGFGPQLGPSFTQMKNNNYDYRRVYVDVYKNNGKLKKVMAKFSNGLYETTDEAKWITLTNKYFAVAAMPETNLAYKYSATQATDTDLPQANSIYISRPATTANTSDTIYFYAGPQLKSYLGSYYSGMDNDWDIRHSNLDAVMDGGSLFGWLENILKFLLTLLYKIIPNYGIGIILLTILLKVVLWPLTKKSTDSTAKMSALQPQLQELQNKYKDNPQKLNAEMANLYKEAGVSPMGGCLPMLLQFPILIAFYGLLNKHFELRGAMFIPGWIPDLSVPETIVTLGFNIPLLGNEIHLLPILYTASMIFSMKMTSNQTAQNNQQGQGTMKFMTYGMPILFFFILYSAPSGLLLYWSVQNILTMIQQSVTNKKIKKEGVVIAKEEKVPEAVKQYQEKPKKIEEEKARQEKEKAKAEKKNKK